jgi:preprotein translocase subunit SecG
VYTLIVIIHILVSIFLVASVLLQFGKGASMGSSFGAASTQALFGATGPTTLLAKATIGCAVVFMLTSLYLSYLAGAKVTSVMMEVPAVQTMPAPLPAEPAK